MKNVIRLQATEPGDALRIHFGLTVTVPHGKPGRVADFMGDVGALLNKYLTPEEALKLAKDFERARDRFLTKEAQRRAHA